MGGKQTFELFFVRDYELNSPATFHTAASTRARGKLAARLGVPRRSLGKQSSLGSVYPTARLVQRFFPLFEIVARKVDTGSSIDAWRILGSQRGPFPCLARLIRTTRRRHMVRKILALTLITGSLALAACNTVRGAAADVNSAANAVDNKT
jgi:predicted small secreted protein